MIVRSKYKDVIIEAVSRELRNGLGWSSSFYVEKDDGAGTTVTEFLSRHIFTSRGAAIRSGMVAARKWIDSGFSASQVLVGI